jgi:hypothetical protein
MRLEGLGKLKKSNNFIGIRTRDLPTCSTINDERTSQNHKNILRIIHCRSKRICLYINKYKFASLVEHNIIHKQDNNNKLFMCLIFNLLHYSKLTLIYHYLIFNSCSKRIQMTSYIILVIYNSGTVR